jgi:predicted O-methyltransferase YrrM
MFCFSQINFATISPITPITLGLISGAIVLAADFRRRRLKTTVSVLEFLDAVSTAIAAGYAANRLAWLTVLIHGEHSVVSACELAAWFAMTVLLWRMGTKALRQPKASGEIFCNLLLLGGAVTLIFSFLGIEPHALLAPPTAEALSLLSIAAGGLLLWRVKSRFHSIKREHRILEHTEARGETVQPEYHRATPECPNPERWHMYDSMSAEVEVLDFLKALVVTVKPKVVVETGTFMGISTLRIADGLRENGFGRVITCEYDAQVFESARKRFAASDLDRWIEARNESSLEMRIDGGIDLLFSDSDVPIREQEVRRFLPHINPNGLILMHDASSAMKTVRDAALRLEAEGLLSVVLLSTPRGLVLAQKREGRR